VRDLTRRLTTASHFEWLRREVSPEVGTLVDRMSLPGIYTIPDKERVHPAGSNLSAIVGVTDIDDRGLEGIELACDSLLAGTPGWRVLQRVAGHSPQANFSWTDRSPEAGRSVELTINTRIQSVVERELERAVRESQARQGIAVVLDPRTSEVLAMSAVVGRGRGASVRPTMNLVTSMQLEPGSTFKLVAFAAAIEKKLFRRFDLIDGQKGYANLGGYVLHDSHASGLITFQEAFERSSNICTAKVANRVGEEGLYRMARRFGFGTRTGIDLPGEIPGLLRKPRDWSGRSLGTIAIGHEVTITPLQLACAYAAVANGGILYEPRVVRRVVDRAGRTVSEPPLRPVRRVISEETARMLREFMQGVVVVGTAKTAYLDRWTIAGKTGTAYKIAQGRHGYDSGRVVSSFAGFVPAWDPKLVAVVVIDEPAGQLEGGMVAAPAFRAMVERLVSTSPVPLYAANASFVGPLPSREGFASWEGFLANRPPREEEGGGVDGERQVAAGTLSKDARDVRAVRNAKDVRETRAAGDVREAKFVKAGRRSGARPAGEEEGEGALPDSAAAIPVGPEIPDLFGMSLRFAVQTLREAGFEPSVEGTGIVVEQTPAAGGFAPPGSRVTVRGQAVEVALAAAVPASQDSEDSRSERRSGRGPARSKGRR
jgi:cell division protein FtsI (penicillin-binding protein 3)